MPAGRAANCTIVVDIYVMARVKAWAKERGVSLDEALLFLLGGFDKPSDGDSKKSK